MGVLLPDQISKTITEAFVDRFICVLKALKQLMDQGTNFISNLIKKVAYESEQKTMK